MIKCKYCDIYMTVSRTGEDEFEAECPECGYLIN